ncbi:MAG TPA: PQQ-dependent sugar dehydrogenase [Pyrinomonadaceae bacterium]|jgi:glucose/arabinose dehydrogenase|nr:PQQ-dependent sugar dehydrogenase [Pyrinomonadaceae bacterium]
MKRSFLALFILTAVVAAGLLTKVETSVWAQASDLPTLALTNPIGGFSQPVVITHAGDGSGRVFVIEQTGRVRLVKNGALLTAPFLDISARISTGGERGLLGLAFPPNYAAKGYFYVNYTNTAGDTVVSRFLRSSTNADAADPASEQIVLTVAQPFPNHNGGNLAFGPRDGALYIGMGDGGSGGDPGNRAQNPAELLGKMLRLDVETGRPFTYTVPASNPFAGNAAFRPEIWATGLRNPWRFSFDRLNGDLFIGDVGQGNWEEIDFQPGDSRGGENYGWRIMEGTRCFNANSCNQAGLVLPVAEYSHAAGDCSVTGGLVHHGPTTARMQGLYFYGDYCSGRIWALRLVSGAWQNTLLLDTNINISTFGEDEAGNLYVASHNTGQIFTVSDTAPGPTPTPTPNPAEIRFGSPSIVASESGGRFSVPVQRSGDSTTEVSVDYATADGTASSRTDYTEARGTLRFAPGETQKLIDITIINDDTQEPDETLTMALTNVVGRAVLEGIPNRLLTITNDDQTTAAANPIDRSDFFVRQHYLDFFSREPDAEGLAHWIGVIESCQQDAQCREVRRINVSAAFFLSIEFQETGFLAYLAHKAAFGNIPNTPVPIRFRDFLADAQKVGRGVVVNQGDWRALLEANKADYLNDFVSRPAFAALYPPSQTPAQYVDALNANTGLALSTTERNDLVARLADGRETRAGALRRITEDGDFRRAETNGAFVLMQYFGYLRRNPNDEPEEHRDFAGYQFWLGNLNRFNGNFEQAELVKAFITSIEYRQRFVTP